MVLVLKMLINNCTLLKAKTHSSKSKIIYIIYIFVLKKKKRRLSAEELMLLNCGVREDS